MKILRKAVITSLGILPFLTPIDFAMAESATEIKDGLRTNVTTLKDDLSSNPQDLPWKKSRFILEAQSGSRTIGTLDAMIPFMGDNDFMVYANLMAKFGTGAKNKNGNTFEGNAGFGVRRVNDSETAIYGAYAYFDYLRSVNDNTFQQVTIGAERLGLTWDFRANAYLPIGTTEYNKTTIDGVVIDQHNLIQYFKSTSEKATAGADIEVGRTLLGSDKLRGYLAAYTFGKDLTGPRARLEYKINNKFTLTGALQHDKDRGTQYLMGARFTLGGVQAKKSDSIYNRMTDKVIRDVDVVTSAHTTEFTNTLYDKFWVVDLDTAAGGKGTLDNPFGFIDEAIEAAPNDAIIYVKGSTNDGPLSLLDSLTLNPGQMVWGGYMPLYYDFDSKQYAANSTANSTLVMAASGVRQTLGGTVYMADNSSFSNIDIAPLSYDANGNPIDFSGIVIDGKQNVKVDNVNIAGFKAGDAIGADADSAYSAVLIKGNSTATLNNVTLDNNDLGVMFENGVVTFNNLTVNGSTTQGVKQTGGYLTLNEANISGNTLNGVQVENANLTVNGGSFNNNLINGIYADASTLDINNAIIDGNAHNGIELNNSSNLVNLGNSTISNNVLHGLQIDNSIANINHSVFSENALANKDYAFDLDDLNSAIQVNNGGSLIADGLTVKNNAAGIELVDGSVNINNSLIDNNTGYGIWAHMPAAPNNGPTGSLIVSNTDVTNTKKIPDGTLSGHGIYADNVAEVSLNHINVMHNEGTGIWLHNSNGDNNSYINVIGNGSEIQERNSLSDLSYGVRIDNDDSHHRTITLDNLFIEGSHYHGLLVHDADVRITNFWSINNEDGVLLTQGRLNITNGVIDSNKRYGIYVKRYNYNQDDHKANRSLLLNNVVVSKTINKNPESQNPVEYTGHGLAVDHNSSISITNSQFIGNDGYGIWAKAGSINMSGDAPNGDAGKTSSYTSQISQNGMGGFKHGYQAGNYLSIDISNTAISKNKGTGIYVHQVDGLKLDRLLINENSEMGATLTPSFTDEIISEMGYGISNSIIKDHFSDSGKLSRIRKNLDKGNNTFRDGINWV